MYDYVNASFNKAGEYFEDAEVLIENKLINSGTMICIQTAAECYLSSIIEGIHKKPIDNNKIYPSNEKVNELIEEPYNISLKKDLNNLFLNYQAMRHSKDSSTAKGSRIVYEHDILMSFSTLEEIKEFASLVHERVLDKEQDMRYEKVFE